MGQGKRGLHCYSQVVRVGAISFAVVASAADQMNKADAGSASQKDLIQRVRSMVAEGADPESAQQQIVEELVHQSQDEVRRRVVEIFGPMRLEAEGELYNRQLAVAHELEALEAKVIALRGGTYCEEAKMLGFDFGLSAQVRQNLRAMPGVRRTTSGSSGSLPMRFNSSLSQRDSEPGSSDVPRNGSQTLVALSNGTAAVPGGYGGSPRGASKPDLGFVISPRSASPKELMGPGAAQVGDSSPLRRLQAGQRVVLPNGLVAMAMPASGGVTPGVPQVVSPGSVTPGVPPSPSRSQVLGPVDGSPSRPQLRTMNSMPVDGSPSRPQLRPMNSMPLQGELTPSQRLQLAGLQADSSPSRRLQTMNSMTSQPGDMLSSLPLDVESPRRQSMGSTTSQNVESPRRQSMGSTTSQNAESPRRAQLQSMASMTTQNVDSPRRQLQSMGSMTSQGADSPRRQAQSMASMSTQCQAEVPRDDVQQTVSIQTAASAEVTPQPSDRTAESEVPLSLTERLQSLKEKSKADAEAAKSSTEEKPTLARDAARHLVQSQPVLMTTPSTTSIRSVGPVTTPGMPRPVVAQMGSMTLPATVPMPVSGVRCCLEREADGPYPGRPPIRPTDAGARRGVPDVPTAPRAGSSGDAADDAAADDANALVVHQGPSCGAKDPGAAVHCGDILGAH
ncbi:unnamed protein product [Symbiodinium natans]|uniref:Uncharacterized protein n=1 Tax=Symbiodinium natans TaxID=878477 RepID=A0A812LEL5_9DINO|nr:unnamed protein product [Symbiodinium natans]